MSLRSPLGQVLGRGSAKDGTAHFWGQRVSGVGLLLLGLWFACALATMPGFSHAEALAFIGAPLNSVLLLLLVITLAYHSYLGVQVVIEDYVHSHGLKLASLIISRFAHSFLAVAALFAILKIGLGA
ncbi:MAG: succinate dehydrogenase, hydrophobic membrane anchor protein [Gammaproteobacteria bacterium]|jgi:succinate dehydrogenase / fumarate reductase membrane anchor subunit|nr:succinate dehydrogenase, hydrophobic membrane anchor protein [Gammaproteobacteria bacterium]